MQNMQWHMQNIYKICSMWLKYAEYAVKYVIFYAEYDKKYDKKNAEYWQVYIVYIWHIYVEYDTEYAN